MQFCFHEQQYCNKGLAKKLHEIEQKIIHDK